MAVMKKNIKKAKGLSTLTKDRGPSAKLAMERAKAKAARGQNKKGAADTEAAARKAGGYGKAVVSIWDVPKGGIKNSPAYKAVLVRCEAVNSKMPPPEQRAGAPVKGGFPLNKYPPNVLVDGKRDFWVPDDWAQAVKNTGPGGKYIGWMSPAGKFFYHRAGYPTAIEETLGKKLTALDGWNGMYRGVAAKVSVAADKKFLQQCLSPSERKHLLPKEKFHFAIVSAFRAEDETGIENCLKVEIHFRIAGIKPTWYVDAGGVEKYKALGLNAVAGGKLTPARNLALNVAKKKGLLCVQCSDDISKWTFVDCAKQSFKGCTDFSKQNQAALGANNFTITPVAAAQWMAAKMRSCEDKPKLAGVFPSGNATLTIGLAEYNREHFILGDFFVAEPSSPCRFDESITLKEDYDYTCSHIRTHGSVLRCNRMVISARHSSNAGGAVAARDSAGVKERVNIAILQKKWPGVFIVNKKRKDEVLMRWSGYGKERTDDKAEGGKGKGAKLAKGKLGKMGANLARKVIKQTKVANATTMANATTVELSNGMTVKLNAKVKYVAAGKAAYIEKRCKRCDGRAVRDCLGLVYTDGAGNEKKYGKSDLRYDIERGSLKVCASRK